CLEKGAAQEVERYLECGCEARMGGRNLPAGIGPAEQIIKGQQWAAKAQRLCARDLWVRFEAAGWHAFLNHRGRVAVDVGWLCSSVGRRENQVGPPQRTALGDLANQGRKRLSFRP